MTTYAERLRAALAERGLINLLRAGHSVRTAQFSVDELVVDGHAANWCVLNEWAARTK